MATIRLGHLEFLRSVSWHEDGWFIRHFLNHHRQDIIILLQRPPCSGKEPGPEDRYEKAIPVSAPKRRQQHPTWFHALGDGNPGAMSVIKEINDVFMREAREVDREDVFAFLFANEIIGPELWKLYKNHLDEEIMPLIDHTIEAARSSFLPFSPDNFLIDPDMRRRDVRHDPLNRSPGPPDQA